MKLFGKFNKPIRVSDDEKNILRGLKLQGQSIHDEMSHNVVYLFSIYDEMNHNVAYLFSIYDEMSHNVVYLFSTPTLGNYQADMTIYL